MDEPAERPPDLPSPPDREEARGLRRTALYPGEYAWFVLISALDIMLTWVILHLGGREVNPVAEWVIQTADLYGIIGLKLGVVVLVVAVCETLGRKKSFRSGRLLARTAVGISLIPIVASLLQIAIYGV
ncbi:MAG: DUF5658 family protein [Phycisphaeraceae bacterium]